MPPPGHRVIEGADVLAWVPVAWPEAAPAAGRVAALARQSRAQGPVALGLLHLAGGPAALGPGPGLLLVGWCAAGAPLGSPGTDAAGAPRVPRPRAPRAKREALFARPVDAHGRTGDPVVLRLARSLGAAAVPVDELAVLGPPRAPPVDSAGIAAWRLAVRLGPAGAPSAHAPGLVLEVVAPREAAIGPVGAPGGSR